MRKLSLVLAAVLTAAVAGPIHAATYVVPEDRVLVNEAESIFVGTAVRSWTRYSEAWSVETVTAFRVEESLKGSLQDYVEVVEPGGTFGGTTSVVADAPTFAPQERALLLLWKRTDGARTVLDFALGKFSFVDDVWGQSLLVRSESDINGWDINLETHREGRRSATQFLEFIRAEASGDSKPYDYFVQNHPLRIQSDAHNLQPRSDSFPAGTYCLGSPVRWAQFPSPVSYDLVGSEPGAPGTPEGKTALTTAIAGWNGASSGIKLQFGSAKPAGTTSGNYIAFDQNISQPSYSCSSGGILGVGGFNSSGSHMHPDGEIFQSISKGYVRMNMGIAGCTALLTSGTWDKGVMHEIGHTIGFRHSDQNVDGGPCPGTLDCTSTAIMNSSVNHSISVAPQAWDIRAATAVYPGTATCVPPSISNDPTSRSITAGSSTTLTVSATGTSLTYQWYQGSASDTSSPIGTNSSSITVSPASNTNYWVRVSGACAPTADSGTATVTIIPCPSVTDGAPSAVAQGNGFHLTAATPSGGTTFTYQWFTGNSGDTSTPVATGSAINVAPSVPTSYWVRVKNQCNNTGNSPSVMVTPTNCPSVNVGTPEATPTTPGSFALSVTASGGSTFTYTWHQGNTPGSGPTLGTGNPFTVTPSMSTAYWVHITNDCGNSADSNTVTIIVTPTCRPFVIVNQPQDQSVTAGSTVSLTVGYTGSTASIVWYRGIAGDTSTPVGSGQTVVSPVLNANSSFWARLTNECDTADSRTEVVTVTQNCVAPAVTSVVATPMMSNAGDPVALAVTATGTSLAYQWYRGVSGDTSNPIPGATAPSIMDTPTVTTSYWVQISSGCGSGAANSNAVTVTIQTSACTAPTLELQPANVTIKNGTGATLTAGFAGTAPLHYQWYTGIAPDISHPVGTDADNYSTGALHATSNYWVRASNSCGSAITGTINVKVETERRRSVRH